LQGDITHATDEDGLRRLLDGLPTVSSARPVHIVLSVSPTRSRGDTHSSLYPAAARGAVRLACALGAQSLLYTSSTGVYGVNDGSWVSESRPFEGADERQRALRDAEHAILHDQDGQVGRIVLRVSGLYGPGRDPGPRFAQGGLDDGGLYWCNFSWQEDVALAVSWLQSQDTYHRGAHIFNCADGAPVLARDIARAFAIARGERSASDAVAVEPLHASRQRISVGALRATGWSTTVPDVYVGLRLLGHDIEPVPSAVRV